MWRMPSALYEQPGGGAGGGKGGDVGDKGSGPGAGGNSTPWFQGKSDIPVEFVGTWQTMGLHTKTPEEGMREITKSYLEAPKFIGVPENQILRMPKDAADEQGWQALRTRLGVPTDPKQYEEGIKAVQRAGKPLEAPLVDLSRDLAAKLHLPQAEAPALAQGIVAHLDRQEAAALAERTAALEASRAALAKDWGANKAANELVARNAAARLGIDPQAVNALESVVGYEKVMNMFLKLGQGMGEDRLITGGGTGIGQGGVLSQAQAQAQLAELKADKAFVARYFDGDRDARRQMDALHKIIAGIAA